MTTIKQSLPPKYKDPVRSIDLVDKDGKSAGSVTFRGKDVWSNRSTGGGSRRVAQGQAEARRQAEAAEKARQEEIQKQIARDKARIQAEINKLNLVRTYTGRDIKSGNVANIKEYRRGSRLIREFKEKDTGVTRYEIFGAGRGGGSRQLRKTFGIQKQTPAQKEALAAKEKLAFQKLVLSQNVRLDPSKLSLYQKANRFLLRYLRPRAYKIETSKDLEKQRDIIYNELEKVYSKYGEGELEEEEYKKFQNELAPIIAKYKLYDAQRNEYLKSIPDKEIKAVIEYDPSLGQDILVPARKDLTLSNKLDEAIQKATIETRRKPGSSSETRLLGLSVAKTGIDFAKGIANIPTIPVKLGIGIANLSKKIIKDPSTIKSVGDKEIWKEIYRNTSQAISQSGKRIGDLIRVSPTTAVAVIGANYILYKGTQKAISSLLKFTSVGKIKSIKFIGTQKQKGRNIVTNVIFEANKGRRVGIARGLTISVGKGAKKGATIVGGKIAKTFKSLPTKGISFLSGDLSKISPKQFKLVQKIILNIGKNKPVENLLKRQVKILRIAINKLNKKISSGISRVGSKISAKKTLLRRDLIFKKNQLQYRLRFINSALGKVGGKVRAVSGKVKAVSRKVGGRIKSTKQLIKGDVKIRISKLSENINKISKKIDNSRIIQKINKINKSLKSSSTLVKGDLIIRRQRLVQSIKNQINKLSREYQKIKRVLSDRKILIKGDVKIRLNRISNKISELNRKISSSKIPTSIRRFGGRIRSTKQLIKGDIQIRSARLKRVVNKIVSDSKFYKRFRKIVPKKTQIVIKNNVKGMQQFSTGRIKSEFQKKIPEFMSKSNIFSRDELSLIVGDTIVNKRDKIKFIGLIKGFSKLNSGGGLSTLQKLQYPKAINKIAQAIATAQAKRNTLVSKTISRVVNVPGKIRSVRAKTQTPTRRTSPTQKTLTRQVTSQKTSVKVSPTQRAKVIGIQRTLSKQKSELNSMVKQKQNIQSKLKSRLTQKTRTQLKNRLNSLSRQAQAQRSKIKLQQRMLLKQQMRSPRPTIIPPGINPPGVGIILPPKSTFTSKTLSRPVQTFYVVEKVRGKFKKLYPKPLTMKDARDYATYSIDHRLSRTAFFIPLGKAKRVVRPPKQIANYYSKNSKKFRPYRIRFGKKRQLVNGFIEKRKYAFDKPKEKRTASNLRRIKRRINPSQRKELLRRLKMARAVRMRNLRRRK
jgi:hypothetical protein